jgi:hypothetical protein
MAPEVCNIIGTPRITEKADIFSLGCILYYLLYRKEAFTSNEEKKENLSKRIEQIQRRVQKSHP